MTGHCALYLEDGGHNGSNRAHEMFGVGGEENGSDMGSAIVSGRLGKGFYNRCQANRPVCRLRLHKSEVCATSLFLMRMTSFGLNLVKWRQLLGDNTSQNLMH